MSGVMFIEKFHRAGTEPVFAEGFAALIGRKWIIIMTNKPKVGQSSIPVALLLRLEQDDPVAWMEFFQQVYVGAREAINNALTVAPVFEIKEARRLIDAYHSDPVDIEVALDLARTSFQNHFLKRTRTREIQTETDCASLLIRVTYNRWQRDLYRERQLRRHADLGAMASEGPSLIERLPDAGPGPEDDVDLADFLVALEDEAVHFAKHLKDEDRRIVYLTVLEKQTPRQIHTSLKGEVSLARICDVIRLWRLHLRQRYPQTLDFVASKGERNFDTDTD